MLRPVSIVLVLLAAFSLGQSMASAQAASAPPVTICIDPGHPSEVGSGATGRLITEMQAAWDVANRMKAILAADGVNVVMTKTSESEFVRNRRRAEIANAAHADLMVRLHCDGGNGIGSGFAVYYPDRQGRSDGATGPSARVIALSATAARCFYAVLKTDLAGKLGARGLHSDTATRVGAKQGALTGSVFSKVPVLLVEMCVLTDASDDAFIASKSGQQAMASALSDAALKAVRAVNAGR